MSLQFTRLLAAILLAVALGGSSAAQPGRTDVVRLFAGPGDTAYATSATSTRIYRTADGGLTWGPSGDLPRENLGYPIDPLLPGPIVTSGDVLFVWGSVSGGNTFSNNNRARSADRGQTWESFSTGSGANPVDFLAASLEGGFVISAYGDGSEGFRRQISRSDDDGATWTDLSDVDGNGLALGFVKAISARRDLAAVFGVSYSLSDRPCGSEGGCVGVYFSTDRARTWLFREAGGEYDSQVGVQDLPDRVSFGPDGALYAWARGKAGLNRLLAADSVWTLVPLPDANFVVVSFAAADNGTLFLGTDDGLFVSLDEGLTWTYDGLGGVINEIERTQAGTILALAGQTLWRRSENGVWSQGSLPVSGEVDDLYAPIADIVSHPNPASRSLILDAVGFEGDVTVEALDILGRRVSVLHRGSVVGPFRLAVEIESWLPGVYVLRAVGRDVVRSTLVTVTR